MYEYIPTRPRPSSPRRRPTLFCSLLGSCTDHGTDELALPCLDLVGVPGPLSIGWAGGQELASTSRSNAFHPTCNSHQPATNPPDLPGFSISLPFAGPVIVSCAPLRFCIKRNLRPSSAGCVNRRETRRTSFSVLGQVELLPAEEYIRPGRPAGHIHFPIASHPAHAIPAALPSACPKVGPRLVQQNKPEASCDSQRFTLHSRPPWLTRPTPAMSSIRSPCSSTN